MIALPLVGDAEAEFGRDAAERRSAETCPGKRRTPMAMGVFHPCGTALCNVDRLDLDEQDTRRCDELCTPSEQGPGGAADADVPVGQQEGLPGSLTRKGANTDRHSAVPPRAMVLATARGATSIPTAKMPWCRSALHSRPGPQPTSRTGPAQRSSRVSSALVGCAYQRCTGNQVHRPSVSRRYTGPPPVRRASA